MRGIIWGDIDLLARFAAALPENDRSDAIERVLFKAHCADLYRKQFGKTHSKWGPGSVAGVIGSSGAMPDRLATSDPDYLRAMALVCGILADRAEAGSRRAA